MDVRRIWDHAPYNAFTDLIHYGGRWLCIFREGSAHAGDKGELRLITSIDGEVWRSLAEFSNAEHDLRDAKFSITPQGELMINTFVSGGKGNPQASRSVSYFSRDGEVWRGPFQIGDPGFWLWRTTWHDGVGYSIGYGHVPQRIVRLYRTRDGKQYETVVPVLNDQNGPSEYALRFEPDGSCLCLLRRDGVKGGDHALLGRSLPPYAEWQWQALDCRIGCPDMIRLPDGRLITAVRKYEFSPEGRYLREWLELCRLDEAAGRLETLEILPSGGDCGYAGMVWHENRLWLSYYSSHEEKPCIYLACGVV